MHFAAGYAIVTAVEIFAPLGLCEVCMKLLQWCKANAMPVIAVLAAAMTAVFVPPDADYLGYYDVKTLSCLLCVLAVVGARRQHKCRDRRRKEHSFPRRDMKMI